MEKSTILHTIRKEILFLFEWYYIVNIIVTSKNKNKVAQNAPSFIPREKKKTRQLKIHN